MEKQSETGGTEYCHECEVVDQNLAFDCPDAPIRPPGIHRHYMGDRYWIWLLSDSSLDDPQILDTITGKYLFFASNHTPLLEIAHAELNQHDFHEAKIPGWNPPGRDYVLCLYHSDDSRKYDLQHRVRTEYAHLGVKYRYWKSDEDTRAGKYSEEFRCLLP